MLNSMLGNQPFLNIWPSFLMYRNADMSKAKTKLKPQPSLYTHLYTESNAMLKEGHRWSEKGDASKGCKLYIFLILFSKSD